MKRLLTFILLATLLACTGGANDATLPAASAPVDAHVSFVPVHLFIDPHGKPLACYQVTVIATSGDAKLVGIEGGESPAFDSAPYYDPHALRGNRVILGAYSLGKDLPAGNTRVATLMFRVAGSVPAHFDATLEVAGATDATPIEATVSLVPAKAPRRANPETSRSLGDAR